MKEDRKEDETLLSAKVPPSAAGTPLLDYLAGRFRYKDAPSWEKEILAGRVTLDRETVSPGHPLAPGGLISYRVVLREPEVDRDIRILHEEEGFLVASKPGNLPSHADGNFIKHTFIHLLARMLKEKGFGGKAKLLHRLDRETSGVMVVSKTKEAHRALTLQFEEGSVEKGYLAVVTGEIAEERFEVKGAVGRDPGSAISIRRKVVPDGTPDSQPALTLFERIGTLKGRTLLRCVPKTGRTNQIRVHLDSIGHPVVGDKLYGRTDAQFLEFVAFVKGGGDPRKWEEAGAPRQMLHASKLSFKHPVTGEPLNFEVPLPPDMASLASRVLEEP